MNKDVLKNLIKHDCYNVAAELSQMLYSELEGMFPEKQEVYSDRSVFFEESVYNKLNSIFSAEIDGTFESDQERDSAWLELSEMYAKELANEMQVSFSTEEYDAICDSSNQLIFSIQEQFNDTGAMAYQLGNAAKSLTAPLAYGASRLAGNMSVKKKKGIAGKYRTKRARRKAGNRIYRNVGSHVGNAAGDVAGAAGAYYLNS